MAIVAKLLHELPKVIIWQCNYPTQGGFKLITHDLNDGIQRLDDYPRLRALPSAFLQVRQLVITSSPCSREYRDVDHRQTRQQMTLESGSSVAEPGPVLM